MKIKQSGNRFAKINKKRGAVYSVVALMLCTAVYLNWSYTSLPNDELVSSDASKNYGDSKLVDNTSGDITSVVNENDNMEGARITRTKSRDEAISMLNKTINNEKSTKDAKDKAAETVSVMSSQVLSEGTIETMITAKGYDDSVVFVNDTGVNVLIEKASSDFTAKDAAIIKDIVLSETSVTADKIKIVESN